MARMPKLVAPGYLHQVTQRGNSRQQSFFSEDGFRRYMSLVSEYAHRAETGIWA